jgi:hypothetical protein
VTSGHWTPKTEFVNFLKSCDLSIDLKYYVDYEKIYFSGSQMWLVASRARKWNFSENQYGRATYPSIGNCTFFFNWKLIFCFKNRLKTIKNKYNISFVGSRILQQKLGKSPILFCMRSWRARQNLRLLWKIKQYD